MAAAEVREWVPLPLPTLMRESPTVDDTFGGALEPSRKDHLLNARNAWVALMGWAFILVMILLVVMPTESMTKLTGRYAQPVSGGAYGPLISIFAIVAVIVAVVAGFVIWIAMGREYDPPHDPNATQNIL